MKKPPQPKPRSKARSAFAEAMRSAWQRTARPNQLPPAGDWWRIWLLLAGRGFGKTRSINEFVRAEVERGAAARIALVGATAAAVRDVLVTGHSGILAVSPDWCRPIYEPTKRLLTWPNGAVATCYSADEPDQLRGPQFDLAICDELAAWRRPEALDMLLLGLRIGKNPRVAIATTPRPTKVIRDLLSREGRDVVVTRGSTLENREHLAAAYIEQIIERYRGTRLERQEVFGEVLEDVAGALWSHENLEESRVAEAPQTLQRVIVAVDPGGSTEEGADETGIVVCGVGSDGHGYVLDDLSGKFAPTEWARRALGAYHVWKADVIVCEINYGGAMVANTIAAVDANVPVKQITSSRGKVLRAEPIAAFFEQRRAHMVGSRPELEDQMCRFTSDWTRARDGSPDRVDAMVFALTELLLVEPPGRFIREEALLRTDLAEGTAPVPVDVPQGVEGVFAFAAITEDRPGELGTIYFAYTGGAPPLVVLDWDIAPLELVAFDEYFPSVYSRLEELVKVAGSRSEHAVLRVEAAGPGLGATLYEQGRLRGHYIERISDKELLAKPLVVRIIEAGDFVTSGAIKLTRPAHEKATTFRGVFRNHLTAELSAFRLGAEKTLVGPLLAAFSTGALNALSRTRHLNNFLALASDTHVAPTMLGCVWAPLASAGNPASPPQPPAPPRPTYTVAQIREQLRQKERGQ